MTQECKIVWRAIADELPSDAQSVLVFAPPPWEGDPIFVAHIEWPDGNDEWWWIGADELDWPKETVSHWAYLPDVPTAKPGAES